MIEQFARPSLKGGITFSRHDRLFFLLAGASCAALTAAVLAFASWHYEPGRPVPDKMLTLVIAITSFSIFHRFKLLLSARHVGYMMRRATGRWLSLVAIVMLVHLLVPGITAAVPRQVISLWAITTLPLLLAALAVMRWSARRIYASTGTTRRAVFLLPGKQAHVLGQRLRRSPVLNIDVAGYFGTLDKDAIMPRLGSLDDAIGALEHNTYNVVFIGIDLLNDAQGAHVGRVLGNSTASVYMVPETGLFGHFGVSGTDMAGIPLLALHEHHILGLARALKRSVDLVIGSLALILTAPIMLVIAVWIRLESPGPTIFRQTRYGLDGKAITVYKFRTMIYQQRDNESVVPQATVNDVRITALGSKLRRSSLDELPQLLNVLKGDMSLVGPRPHAAAHNELYRTQIHGYMLRHSVKPGITGWAQVNGLRGETDTLDKMRRRVEYDHEYIQNWSLGLDLRILLKTVQIVFGDKAAY